MIWTFLFKSSGSNSSPRPTEFDLEVAEVPHLSKMAKKSNSLIAILIQRYSKRNAIWSLIFKQFESFLIKFKNERADVIKDVLGSYGQGEQIRFEN